MKVNKGFQTKTGIFLENKPLTQKENENGCFTNYI